MKKNKFCFLAVTLTIFIVTGLTGCSSADNSTAEEQEEVYTDESGYEVINYEGYDYDYLYANLFNGNSQSFIDEVWNNSGLDDKLGQKTVHGLWSNSKYIDDNYRMNKQKRTEIFGGTIQLTEEFDCSIVVNYKDEYTYSEGWMVFEGLTYGIVCSNESEAQDLYMEIYDKLSTTLSNEDGIDALDVEENAKEYDRVAWAFSHEKYLALDLSSGILGCGEWYDDDCVVEVIVYEYE